MKFEYIKSDSNDPRNYKGFMSSINSRKDWEHEETFKNVPTSTLRELLMPLGVALTPRTKILEAGVGKAEFLSRMLGEGFNIRGIDGRVTNDDGSPRFPDGLPVTKGRIEKMDFADNEFEVIFMGSVFDSRAYDQDTEKMWAEIYRVLKPGGIVICDKLSTKGGFDFPPAGYHAPPKSIKGLKESTRLQLKTSYLNVYQKDGF